MSVTTVMNDAFEVSDFHGQAVHSFTNVRPGTKVAALIERAVALLRLPTRDPNNAEINYAARSDREGRHLLGSEDVTDAIMPGDRIVLQPNVDAGKGLCKSTIGS